jgi:glycerol kinase
MQIQADLLGTKVIRPEITETTALGAAYLAGMGIGFWKDLDEVKKQWKMNRCFEASENNNAGILKKGWQRAVKAAKAWAAED